MTCKQCRFYTFKNRYCKQRKKQMAAWGECPDLEPKDK